VTQNIGSNLYSVTKCDDSSMVALHLPHVEVGTWVRQFAGTGFMHVKAPLIIGSKSPGGYSASWKHMPLVCTQTFTLFKQQSANKPTHNAWKVFVLNPNIYRNYWSDLQLIPSQQYKKDQTEIRKMVIASCSYCNFFSRPTICIHILCTFLQPKGTLADLEVVQPIGEVKCGNATYLLDKIDKRCIVHAKSRRTHMRKEQISLGVLKRLLESIGRFSYEEVGSHVHAYPRVV